MRSNKITKMKKVIAIASIIVSVPIIAFLLIRKFYYYPKIVTRAHVQRIQTWPDHSCTYWIYEETTNSSYSIGMAIVDSVGLFKKEQKVTITISE